MEIGQVGSSALPSATSGNASVAENPAVTNRVPSRAAEALGVKPAAIEPRRQALSILRQEIRQVLQSSFRIKFAASAPGYVDPGRVDAGAVTGDALNGAAAAAQRSPLKAGRIMVDLRERVEQSIRDVRELVGEDDDDLEDAVSRIGAGLDDIDDDVARNQPSSATVLSAESKLRQRSTIRIRTQEGDVVRFDLRRVEKFSAEDVSISSGDSFYNSTEIELSSRSRMRLRVQGDINEAEYAAIQNVFAQAERIADDFFGGDLAAAFSQAAAIEFDSEQLARVNMRFREKLQTEVRYAAAGPVLAQPAPAPATTPEPAPVAEPVRAMPTIEPAVVKPTEVKQPIAPAPAIEVPEAPKAVEKPSIDDNALDGFFGLLSDFLRSVSTGIESSAQNSSFRFYYSKSFNLQILRSVLDLRAPDDDQEAGNVAAALVDGLAGERDDD